MGARVSYIASPAPAYLAVLLTFSLKENPPTAAQVTFFKMLPSCKYIHFKFNYYYMNYNFHFNYGKNGHRHFSLRRPNVEKNSMLNFQ